MTVRSRTGVGGKGTPRVPLWRVWYQYIQNAVGAILPQRLILQFTGAPVTVSDDPANNRTIVDLSGATQAGSFIFGAGSSLTSTQPLYLIPGNSLDNPVNTDQMRMISPRAGSLRNMFVKHNRPSTSGGDAGKTLTYTVEKNGAPSTLAVSLAATAASGSNLANTLAVAQGDQIAVKLTKDAILTDDVDWINVTMEFA